MYMAPITRTAPPPARPALRLSVGVPVLLLALLVGLPWLVLNLLLAGLLLGGRFVLETMDHAGQVALGR